MDKTRSNSPFKHEALDFGECKLCYLTGVPVSKADGICVRCHITIEDELCRLEEKESA